MKDVIVKSLQSMEKLFSRYPKQKKIDSYTQKGKRIIFCESMEEARTIKAEIEKNALSLSKGWEKPLRYKSNIIETQGTCTLGLTRASSVTISTIAKEADRIRKAMEKSITTDELIKEQAREAIETLEQYPADMFVKAVRQTGNSYRVQYYDRETESRKQINVCDVLLVVGDTEIVDAPTSKSKVTEHPFAMWGRLEWYFVDQIT